MARVHDAGSDELRFLFNVSSLLARALGARQAAGQLAQLAIEQVADVCAVHLLEDGGALALAGIADRRAVSTTSADQFFARSVGSRDGVIRGAMRSKEAVLFTRGMPRCSILDERALLLLNGLAARSLIVVPLSIGATCIGTLTFVETARRSPYQPSDVALAIAIGEQLSLALENARLQERERRLTDRSRFLSRATDQLFSTLDRTRMFELLLEVITDEIADWAIALSLDDDGLHAVATADAKENESGGLDLEAGTHLFGELLEREMIAAIRQQRPLLVNEVARSPAFDRPHVSDEVHPRGWMMVPLPIAVRNTGGIVCYSSSRRYDDDDLQTLRELCLRVALALEHAETFARERRLTQTLQQATLPSNLATIPGATLSAVYMPASGEERVGGDWYDSFALDDGRVLLTVGDVTGHGLHASVIMGKLRHALNVVALYEKNPSRILDVAEQIILRRYPDAMATAFVAVIDNERKVMTYANAGHPTPVVRCSDGSVAQIAASGLPIGLRYMRASEWALTAELDSVDLLVFYSDGVTEVSRKPLEGEQLLISAIARDTALFVRSAAEYVKACCIDRPTRDDVAILTVNFSGIERWAFGSNEQAAARRIRRQVVERVRERVSPGADLESVKAIFGELIANAARHACGPVDVALAWTTGHPVLHVIDRGNEYKSAEPTPASLFAESGRGLWLVRQLSPALEIEHIPGFGTHVRAVLPVLARGIRSSPVDDLVGVAQEAASRPFSAHGLPARFRN